MPIRLSSMFSGAALRRPLRRDLQTASPPSPWVSFLLRDLLPTLLMLMLLGGLTLQALSWLDEVRAASPGQVRAP